MMPEERTADVTFRSEDQKQFEAMTKYGTGADAQRIQAGLKDFREYVDGLGENYLERKIGNKGYDNPSWQLLSEYKFRYNKWIKGQKTKSFNPQLIAIVSTHLECSSKQAQDYLNILEKKEIKMMLKQIGLQENDIKQLLKK